MKFTHLIAATAAGCLAIAPVAASAGTRASAHTIHYKSAAASTSANQSSTAHFAAAQGDEGEAGAGMGTHHGVSTWVLAALAAGAVGLGVAAAAQSNGI